MTCAFSRAPRAFLAEPAVPMTTALHRRASNCGEPDTASGRVHEHALTRHGRGVAERVGSRWKAFGMVTACAKLSSGGFGTRVAGVVTWSARSCPRPERRLRHQGCRFDT